MPDLQASAEDRRTAVPLEKQTRAFFTRFGQTRQVSAPTRQLLQNLCVAGLLG
jgi:hypothetical protein